MEKGEGVQEVVKPKRQVTSTTQRRFYGLKHERARKLVVKGQGADLLWLPKLNEDGTLPPGDACGHVVKLTSIMPIFDEGGWMNVRESRVTYEVVREFELYMPTNKRRPGTKNRGCSADTFLTYFHREDEKEEVERPATGAAAINKSTGGLANLADRVRVLEARVMALEDSLTKPAH